jgi:cytoskeletal protein RodZ
MWTRCGVLPVFRGNLEVKEVGKKIREARIAREISYETLYERTRIAVHNIEAIEEGKAGHLPKPYFRAFVRAIAREVGLEPEALLREYDSRQRRLQEVKESVHEGREIGSRFSDFWEKRRRMVFVLSVSIFFFTLVVLYIRYGRELFIVPRIPEVSVPLTNPDSTEISSLDSSESGPFVLRAVGLKNTWIEVRVDSGRYEDVFLQKGEKLVWQPEKALFIGVEDSRGIYMTFRGKPLEFMEDDSSSGIDLWITAKGILKQSLRKKESEARQVDEAEAFSIPALVGAIDEKDLIEKFPGYAQRRDQYRPNSVILSRIERQNPSLSIVCFFGTWDPLSREIIPQLLRILQMSYLPSVSLSLVGVDRELKDNAGLVELHSIQGVPTLLFLSRGQELGRIVGQPDERIETRFLEIAERAGFLFKDGEQTERDTLHEDGGNGERFHRF